MTSASCLTGHRYLAVCAWWVPSSAGGGTVTFTGPRLEFCEDRRVRGCFRKTPTVVVPSEIPLPVHPAEPPFETVSFPLQRRPLQAAAEPENAVEDPASTPEPQPSRPLDPEAAAASGLHAKVVGARQTEPVRSAHSRIPDRRLYPPGVCVK